MKRFILLSMLSLSACGDLPDPDHVVGGKTTPWGIGLPCAAADMTCGTIPTFPIPVAWCGCIDYFSYSRAKLVVMTFNGGDPVDAVWPGMTKLDSMLPDQPGAQKIARTIEIGLLNVPQPRLNEFKKLTIAERVNYVWKTDQSAKWADIIAALEAEGL